jgi:hypothetical protein
VIDALRRVAALLADPGRRGVAVLVAGVVGGFVCLGLAWHGAARTIYVPFQLPWLMSAGVAGVALIGTSLASLSVHLERRNAAARRAMTEDMIRAAITLADDVRAGRR